MSKQLQVGIEGVTPFIAAEEIASAAVRSATHLKRLKESAEAGEEHMGWFDLPLKMAPQVSDIISCASRLCQIAPLTVVVGTGGSYLGSRALSEALTPTLRPGGKVSPHRLMFAGYTLCSDYLHAILETLRNEDFTLIVISKSGTTIEPAIAFRLIRALMIEKYGREESARRVVTITDRQSGALREMTEAEGFDSFEIPPDVGGRYSVLTAVGLLPLAVAGADITELLGGAAAMRERATGSLAPGSNSPLLYASVRNMLYNSGFNTEIVASYTPYLTMFAEWWKQLFGESEGKEGRGIFPAAVSYTADLHSMGQYIQEGERRLFETVIYSNSSRHSVEIPSLNNDNDQLGYLEGRSVDYVNNAAFRGTLRAHTEGGVPGITVTIPTINEYHMGELIWFFQTACAVSGLTAGINPFDQPGVEAYKREMKRVLRR